MDAQTYLDSNAVLLMDHKADNGGLQVQELKRSFPPLWACRWYM